MATKINCSEINDYLKKIIDEYGEEVKEIVTEAIEKTGEEGVRRLKAVKFPKGTQWNKSKKRKNIGKYSKSWYVDKEKTLFGEKSIIHNKHYQLTHLLENGHYNALTDKMTKPFPHVGPVNDYLIGFIESEIEKKL